MKRITDWVHDGLRNHLLPGDWALDATLGNGHDAQCLLECVGPKGRVFGLDIQPCAIESSAQRLVGQPGFEAILGDHARMADLLPAAANGQLRAAVFNLGYLPGGDHERTTSHERSLPALEMALDWLAEDGVLACTCYPGMASGKSEADAIGQWLAACSETCGQLTRIEPLNTRTPAPFLLWFEKRSRP